MRPRDQSFSYLKQLEQNKVDQKRVWRSFSSIRWTLLQKKAPFERQWRGIVGLFSLRIDARMRRWSGVWWGAIIVDKIRNKISSNRFSSNLSSLFSAIDAFGRCLRSSVDRRRWIPGASRPTVPHSKVSLSLAPSSTAVQRRIYVAPVVVFVVDQLHWFCAFGVLLWAHCSPSVLRRRFDLCSASA